jgi:hypothetical protein
MLGVIILPVIKLRVVVIILNRLHHVWFYNTLIGYKSDNEFIAVSWTLSITTLNNVVL